MENKGQSEKKRERNNENNCLISLLRGQFLDSKPKLEEFFLIFRRFFENSYAVDTNEKIQ